MSNKIPESQPKLLAPLINSDKWVLIEDYLAVEKDRLVSLLYNCEECKLKTYQGELKAVMKLQNMPINLKAETGT